MNKTRGLTVVDPNEKTIRINGREITVSLTYSQLDILDALIHKFNRLVSVSELQEAFAPVDIYSHRRRWNCRVHITAIRNQISMHGFEILSKRKSGYKLIDKVNPMNDPRDDFETIYATRHLHGDTESMKTLRNDAGSYDDEHMRDCFYIYLMAISKNKGE
jgi:DNA-binding winged helix-turn-helix (wHTH) protein